MLQATVETITPYTAQAEAVVSVSWNGKGVSEEEQTAALKVLQVPCQYLTGACRAKRESAGSIIQHYARVKLHCYFAQALCLIHNISRDAAGKAGVIEVSGNT